MVPGVSHKLDLISIQALSTARVVLTPSSALAFLRGMFLSSVTWPPCHLCSLQLFPYAICPVKSSSNCPS